MTTQILSLKAGDKVTLNGTTYTVNADATEATHCILVGIVGKRGGEKCLCWYPEQDAGHFFSAFSMARSINVKSISFNK